MGLTYYFQKAFMNLLASLPFAALYKVSDVLFYFLFHVFKYRRQLVMSNLENAFPDKSEKERETIAKEFYQNLCDSIFETVVDAAFVAYSTGKTTAPTAGGISENTECAEKLKSIGIDG